MSGTVEDAHLLTQAGLRVCIHTHANPHTCSAEHTHLIVEAHKITGVGHLLVERKEISRRERQGAREKKAHRLTGRGKHSMKRKKEKRRRGK